MNHFWDGSPEKLKNDNPSSSLCIVGGLAAEAPSDIYSPWQRCVAPPQQQTAGCPLHTHDLRDNQRTVNGHKHISGVGLHANTFLTDTDPDRKRQISFFPYPAIIECHHLKCQLCPEMKALLWHCLQTSSLKNNKSIVYSFPFSICKDSRTICLLSNILPIEYKTDHLH